MTLGGVYVGRSIEYKILTKGDGRTDMKMLGWIAFIVLFWSQFHWAINYYGWDGFGADCRIYWLAGAGKIEMQNVPETGSTIRAWYDALPERTKECIGYLYGEQWRSVFRLFTWIPLEHFIVLFTSTCIVGYFYLIWRVINEIHYGWAIALLVTRHVEGMVFSGNVGSILPFALTTPMGMVLAGSLKLHLAGVATLCALIWCFNQRGDSWDAYRRTHLHPADDAAAQTWQTRFIRYCRYLLWAARLELPNAKKHTNLYVHIHDRGMTDVGLR